MSEVKVILEPSVYMVGKSSVNPDEWYRFAKDNGVSPIMGDGGEASLRSEAEWLSECGGRLCYWSFDQPRPGGNAAYLDRIKEQKHGSVIEHASYNFIFTGVSRSLTHELVRHRAGWAYSQLSQRYVDESDCAFVKPVAIPHDENEYIYRRWLTFCLESLSEYKNMIGHMQWEMSNIKPDAVMEKYMIPPDASKTDIRKYLRQTARSVLPNCTETKIMATANCRAIRHFLEQRGGLGAEPEIRRLAGYVLDIVKADSPSIFGDYQTNELPDGTRHIFTTQSKV